MHEDRNKANSESIVTLMAEVRIGCIRSAISTTPVDVGKRHPLSVLDRIMEKKHIRMLLYYPSTGVTVPGEVTRRRRESISDAIVGFPIMTGRLERDERGRWASLNNDTRVRLVEARAKGSLEEWLRNVDKEKELMLVYWEEMGYIPLFWSPFYVQFTEFEDGGLAIGLSCTHLLADATTATMFLKYWADTALTGKLPQSTFLHPLPPRRSAIENPDYKPPTSLINHYKHSINKSMQQLLPPQNNNTTIAFYFSDTMIRTCTATRPTTNPIGATKSSDPSPFEALAGLFWFCISKVKGNELMDMSICMDMRKVLGLDKGFFGNCTVYNKVQQEGINGNTLSEAVRSVSEVVAAMDYDGVIDLIEWLEQNDEQCPMLMTDDSDLICYSLEAVNAFSTASEDGNAPVRVSCYVEPMLEFQRQVIVFPGNPGDGEMSRVVMITLPHDEMVKLREDELILRLSPTIYMDMKEDHPGEPVKT